MVQCTVLAQDTYAENLEAFHKGFILVVTIICTLARKPGIYPLNKRCKFQPCLNISTKFGFGQNWEIDVVGNKPRIYTNFSTTIFIFATNFTPRIVCEIGSRDLSNEP